MRVALFGKVVDKSRHTYIQQLIDELESRGIVPVIYEPFLRHFGNAIRFKSQPGTFEGHEDLTEKADYLISVGGDGTMLEAVTLVRNSGIPVMGINVGRLGFLSNIPKNEIVDAVANLCDGRFETEERSMIEVVSPAGLFGDFPYGLNEFTVSKKDIGSMIQVYVMVNEQFLNTYWADGLIFSTPTGSTAYSLSCSGPILSPESENFVITPIASHNLTVRPIVIPDESVITLRVEGRSDQFLASLDSRSVTIDAHSEITLKKADYSIHLIKRTHDSFYNTIRQKLLWGKDVRN